MTLPPAFAGALPVRERHGCGARQVLRADGWR